MKYINHSRAVGAAFLLTLLANSGLAQTAAQVFQKDDASATPWQVLMTGATNPNLNLIAGVNTSANPFGSLQAYRQGVGPLGLVLQPVGGNVGIGTPTPNYALSFGPTLGKTLALYESNGTNLYGLSAGGSGTGTDPYRVRMFANGSEWMAITAGGNVGIGSTWPTGRLEVNLVNPAGWNGNLKALRVLSPDNSYFLDFNTYIVGAGNVGYQFSPNGNTGMVITTLGNVGIGTTIPNARLEVNTGGGSSGQTGLYVYHSANSGFDVANILSNWQDGSGGNLLRVGNASGNAITVSSSRNVGIGTTNPGTYKLAVKGTIRAMEVVVDTGWSDYVFAPDYALAPLSEVEAHIKEHQHLPGIPSASDVAEHGISVGEMQAKLLAKIEELTLHVIAQEKTVRLQQAEIAAMRAEMRVSKASFP